MNIQVKLNFREYLKLNLILTYKRIITWLFTIIGLIVVLAGLFAMIGIIITQDFVHLKDAILCTVIGLFMAMMIPLIVYRNAKNSYHTSKAIKETINYTFEKDKIVVQGESFNAEMQWDSVWKVHELKDWIVIYYNKLTANIVPKKALNDDQLAALKNVINEQSNIKKKLLL